MPTRYAIIETSQPEKVTLATCRFKTTALMICMALSRCFADMRFTVEPIS